jgi:uncharacterized protein
MTSAETTGRPRAVVLSGGLTHDFPATTACLADLLDGHGLAAEVHTSTEDAFAALPGAALLVVNALRWTMTSAATPDRYRRQAAAEGVSPSPAARGALSQHLGSGGGLLALHTAAICFDDWPEWAAALGGAWVWGRSHHPPLGPAVRVRVAGGHPLTDGVGDFTVVDEVYTDLEHATEVTGLLSAVTPGGTGAEQPLLWAREHGGGRVVYDALGHHPPSYEVPGHREILHRAIAWTARR